MFKTILALAMMFVFSAMCADEVEPPPDDKDVPEEVHDISMLAATVENRLRDDNHDYSVQGRRRSSRGRREDEARA